MQTAKKDRWVRPGLALLLMLALLLCLSACAWAEGGAGYYIVGTMNKYAVDSRYKLTELGSGEYVYAGLWLTPNDDFKVVYSADGSKPTTWYPDTPDSLFGMHGEIEYSDYFNVYFRPNYDGGDNWFYNCIYIPEFDDEEDYGPVLNLEVLPQTGGALGEIPVPSTVSGYSRAFRATPSEDYIVQGVVCRFDDNEAVPLVRGEGDTFLMPSNAVPDSYSTLTVTATFVRVYTISVNSGIINGAVTADKAKAAEGETVTLTVISAQGYVLAENGLTYTYTPDGGTETTVPVASVGGVYRFTMPAGNTSVNAMFNATYDPVHTISVDSGILNGTVSADKTRAAEGETVTLTVRPAAGYMLDNLYGTYTVNGGTSYVYPSGAGDKFTFTMPTGDVTVTAAFKPVPLYSVTLPDSTAGGAVTADKTRAAEGETVTLTVRLAAGYVLDNLYGTYVVNGGTSYVYLTGAGDRFSFTMPAGGVTVTADIRPAVIALTDGSGITRYYSSNHAPNAFSDIPDGAAGYTVTLLDDVRIDTLSFSADKTAALDLNGHILRAEITVSGDLTVSDSTPGAAHDPALTYTDPITGESVTVTGGAIIGVTENSCVTVKGRGKFTMNGGSITGGNASLDGGGVTVTSGGTFTMNDGSITGNSAFSGGGVTVISGGTFTMNDGSITGNSAASGGGGLYVGGSGTFTLAGGSIRGNSAASGGGVYAIGGGTFSLKGAPEISGNTGGQVRLGNSSMEISANITVTGALTNVTPIGVSMDRPGVFTEGWASAMGSADPALHFRSEDSIYVVERLDGEAALSKLQFGAPDFTLPAAITAIGDSAFEGAAVHIVYVPDTCASLGANAFRDCAGLMQIRLPKNCAIGSGAFDGCTALIAVFAPEGGTTQSACAAACIPFITE